MTPSPGPPGLALVAYSDLAADPVVAALHRLAVDADDAASALIVASELFSSGETVAQLLSGRVLRSVGPFASAARSGLAPDDSRLRQAAWELGRLGALDAADVRGRLTQHALGDCLSDRTSAVSPSPTVPPAFTRLRSRLAAGGRWDEATADVARFHREEGIGPLAGFRVLRPLGPRLEGVTRPDGVTLDDLVGGEERRAPLLADLEAFMAGVRPNDALLYGPPGTGKSVTVRACAGSFADRGLRLVQVDRSDVGRLEHVFALLAGHGPRCLVFLDDIVFDDDARADRALRAALEGDVEGRPENVLIWATSNRMRLTSDTFSRRADEVDEVESRGEKGALAERFGRRVRFARPDQDGYLLLARRLVADIHGAVPAGTDGAALRFARVGHGLTPRTARQFAASYRPHALTLPGMEPDHEPER